MKQATRQVPPLALNEVEQELSRMRKVSEEIRLALEKILASTSLDHAVSQTIVEDLLRQLQQVIAKVKQLPFRSTVDSSVYSSRNQQPHTQRISEHGSEYDLHSSQRRERKVNLSDMYDLNQELTEQNDFLAKKLEEAEDYIRKVELQNGLLTNEISALRLQSKTLREEVSFDKRSRQSSKHSNPEVEQLRQDLHEAEDFIAKNNEEFVKELQKYNQKIWRLQSELDSARNKLYESETQLHEQQVVLAKMRDENIQLQVLSRNFRGFITDAPETADRRTELPRRSSKIKEFFKQKIQESLRRKQSN